MRIDVGDGRVWGKSPEVGWIEIPCGYGALSVTALDVERNSLIRVLTPAEAERAERGYGPERHAGDCGRTLCGDFFREGVRRLCGLCAHGWAECRGPRHSGCGTTLEIDDREEQSDGPEAADLHGHVCVIVDGCEVRVVRGAPSHTLPDGRVARLSWAETYPERFTGCTIDAARPKRSDPSSAILTTINDQEVRVRRGAPTHRMPDGEIVMLRWVDGELSGYDSDSPLTSDARTITVARELRDEVWCVLLLRAMPGLDIQAAMRRTEEAFAALEERGLVEAMHAALSAEGRPGG